MKVAKTVIIWIGLPLRRVRASVVEERAAWTADGVCRACTLRLGPLYRSSVWYSKRHSRLGLDWD